MTENKMIDNKTAIPVRNKRSSSYSVSLPNGEYYEWMPAMSDVEDVIELPFRDVQMIHTRSATFKEGYLYIDSLDARKRLGLHKDEVESISLSRAEIEAILKSSSLKKFDKVKHNTALVREIIQVAKELKIDNINKLNYLSDISGIPVEIIRNEEE